ncbi:MAG: hypothetical protein WBM44_03650 [Waterburya sp.]
MENKVIDVSDLSPKQIAMIEEIIATFKSVSQQNNSSQDLTKSENSENSLNLAERIKQRFAHLENVDIPQITRDRMRNPPQFN